MFKSIFGSKKSEAEINEAVNYFFELAIYAIEREDQNPLSLSEEEKYTFRQQYILKNNIKDHGVMFFSKIERESLSFADYHLKQNITSKIQLAWEEKNFSNPLIREVKGHLKNIL
jgi:hypothetical protein